MVTEEAVRTALRQVIDPELGIDIVELNLVRSIRLEGDGVQLAMVLTVPFCSLAGYLLEMARRAVLSLPGVKQVGLELLDEVWIPPGQVPGAHDPSVHAYGAGR